ncbi:RDD family protein [Jannaschia seosinensis]|uniref:RDD family protein n=1 Tax=Jannaschia seosinensis TaxID=313367 RepID=A0A0M7B7Y3_9RHOB|nr:RDD family protein [Jannaschia seosinensis]CUH10844.1 RDD family protein [Jannaschia seosinensis]
MANWTDLGSSVSGLPDPVEQPEFYNGVVTKRAFAWLIDMALITMFTIVAGILTLTIAWFMWPITFLVLGLLYRLATLSSGSATWGMRLMGIELRDHRGARFDGLSAALHVGGYYAAMTFVLPQIASIAAMLISPRRQGLPDLVIGSAAINRPG